MPLTKPNKIDTKMCKYYKVLKLVVDSSKRDPETALYDYFFPIVTKNSIILIWKIKHGINQMDGFIIEN